MTRRELLAIASAGAASGAATSGGVKMGATPSAFGIRLRAAMEAKQPFDILDHAHSLGMGGVEWGLRSTDPAVVKAFRDKLEKYGMYFHAGVRPPREESEVEQFEASVRAAKDAGATLLGAAMTGRRYEVFDSFEAFKKHKEQCVNALRRAEPVLRKHRIGLAFENHKDWRWQEQVAMIKSLGSEYLGARLDTGNNISLCEDPMEWIAGLAPYAFTSHLKDMGVDEYEDGFLLSEVPFGQGIIDLPWVVQTLRRAKPDIQFNLEMITRDPLRVPAYTEKYWVTFDDSYSPLPGRDLARTLAMVRKGRSKTPLPRISHLSREAQIKAEDEYNRACIAYAHERLQL